MFEASQIYMRWCSHVPRASSWGTFETAKHDIFRVYFESQILWTAKPPACHVPKASSSGTFETAWNSQTPYISSFAMIQSRSKGSIFSGALPLTATCRRITVHAFVHNIPRLIFATFSKKALLNKWHPIDPSGEDIWLECHIYIYYIVNCISSVFYPHWTFHSNFPGQSWSPDHPHLASLRRFVPPMPLSTLAQDALDGATWHHGALHRPSPSAFQAMPASLRWRVDGWEEHK